MSITLNPQLMLLVFITFIVLIFLLNIWLYKPMMAFMKNRDLSIEKDLSSTQGYKDDKAKVESEIEQTLSLARKEAAKLLEEAQRVAKSAYEDKISAKRAENEAKLNKAKQELLAQKSELYAELLNAMPSFKSALSAKLKQI